MSASADFEQVIVGLSGGIDSALTAAIAADARGAGKCDWRGNAGAVFFAGIDRRRARAGEKSGHPI